MREIFMYGSVRGVARKGHSYRDDQGTEGSGDGFFCLHPSAFPLLLQNGLANGQRWRNRFGRGEE